ncbi:MAG: ABC transporter substrate-binding protein [Gammaproteobacteria bacterium]|nr:ABC transporter substrate-binding protein [Gammaproteobacteria bacterium]
MNVVLYKLEVIQGKEAIAEEWLAFLHKNKEKALKTLENEQVFIETYFKETVQNTTYIYLYIVCKDLEYANNTAMNSTDPVDVKHLEYMKECINLKAGNIMNAELFLNRF